MISPQKRRGKSFGNLDYFSPLSDTKLKKKEIAALKNMTFEEK